MPQEFAIIQASCSQGNRAARPAGSAPETDAKAGARANKAIGYDTHLTTWGHEPYM